ncbi:hypothetical protein OSB04_010394 [Centaurea solstitialis]|uniref:IPO4/5-like TPR repeats domain-containing protein n=1 Tax=Centaurea solstitialis TaxID=347529 RepID=A0AA38T7H0_9ASTR|nr:hypothetical protein OSB04_010394 [Centaurea solstitialis]
MAMDMQQAQLLAAILWSRDLAPLETLISHLVSLFYEQRSQAEDMFDECILTDPKKLFHKLGEVLHSSPYEGSRGTSATLLQTHGLLCILISELASMILPLNGWPELLRFAFDWSKSDSLNLQESGFLILVGLSQFNGQTLISSMEDIHQVCLECLTSTSRSLDVKLAASSAVASFIPVFSHSGGDLMLFHDVLRTITMTLKEALNSQQEAAAQELLKLLIELVEAVPGLFGRELDKVLEHMMQIATTETLEEGTRHLAIGFLIALVEARERAAMMRELIDDLVRFPCELFAILLKMLLDIEDEPAWYTTDNEDEDAGGSSNYNAAKDYMGLFAIAADALDVTVVAFEQLRAYLDGPEWQEPHAALIALACIFEGFAEKMIQNIETVMLMVLSSFQNPHPRVRWAATNAVKQLAMDLGPNLRVPFHSHVLEALESFTHDPHSLRIQVNGVIYRFGVQ